MTMTRVRSAAMLAAYLVLSVTSCGDSNDEQGTSVPEARPATATAIGGMQSSLSALLQSTTDGDPVAMCAHMTKRGQRRTAADANVTSNSCRKAMAAVIASFGDNVHTNVRVLRGRITGVRAIATVRSNTGNTYLMRLRKTNGSWKVDQSLLN